MKIHLISDLHLTHEDFYSVRNNRGKEAEMLILAGDNGYYTSFANGVPKINFPGHYIFEYRYNLEIKGNHTYYNKGLKDIYDDLEKERGRFVHEAKKHKDYVFISCTLWTNFWNGSFGGSDRNIFFNDLNDFYQIKGMTIDSMTDLFNRDFEFIKENVEKYKDKKIIIVTHFAPSKKSIHPKYKDNVLNPYFVNDLDEFILANPQIKLWCHGHNHCSLDYKIGETRVVCNARGYKMDDGSFENPEFNPDLLIEI